MQKISNGEFVTSVAMKTGSKGEMKPTKVPNCSDGLGGSYLFCPHTLTSELPDKMSWNMLGSFSGESGLAVKSGPLEPKFWFADKL